MRVGGPYTIEISYVGYATQTRDNIFLRLGEAQKINFTLQEDGVLLDELVVVATAGTTGENSGASTQITAETIDAMPTLNRDVSDFLRLTPQASSFGDGTSFAGTNNRFNAIYIDGAVNNDVFGLSGSGTNGGQTGISPFSIDIIDQFQVVLSPYDVTLGGFAGGGVNAVTKSGTNDFKGTAYYFFQNEKLVGKENGELADRFGIEDRERVAEFDKQTYGASLGGPIIKDKVFFFANAEIQDDVTPAPFEVSQYTSQTNRASEGDLNNLRQHLVDTYRYDPGTFGDTQDELTGLKLFGKIDVNINQSHKLTLRHQYTKAEEFDRNAGSSSRINFSNNGVYFPSVTNSSAVELNSTFGTKMANNLIIGYTSVNDDRGSLGNDFPFVSIDDGNGGSIRFGTEEFSTGNLLEQKIFTITNNFKYYMGKHTFTIGTHNEFYDIRNVFIRQNFGSYDFNSIDDFINGEPAYNYDRSYSLIPGDENVIGDDSRAAADFKAMQLGLYAQDQIDISENFKLTAGIRFDVPFLTSDPAISPGFDTIQTKLAAKYDVANDVSPGSAPDGQLMISPRIGFEYLLDGTRNTVIRGGVGVFTSRIPFVWPGAMFNNNGLTIGSVDERDLSDDNEVEFVADVTDQYVDPDFGVPSGQLDLFVSDFKYPQVLRGNLGFDKKIEGGWNFGLEGIFTKTLNNIVYTSVNSDNTVDFKWTNTGADDRPVFVGDNLDGNYSAIYIGSNTNKGYTYNLTASVAKSFGNNLSASLAYTYGDAYSLNDGTSSQNSSQWRGQIHTDGRNNPIFGRSDYAVGSRIVGSLNYKLNWNEEGTFATTFSLFYNGQSGDAFSYVITGSDARNINNERGSTSRNRSLVYVPNDASEINLVDYDIENSDGTVTTVTAAEQWTNLNALIEDDKHLSERRGKYAEKNGARAPFTSIFDFAIRQDLGLLLGGRAHKLQLSLDVFNVANLLNKNWGIRYSIPGDFNNYDLYEFEGYAADGTTPTFTYQNDELGKDRFDIVDVASRWRMRLGVRYIFD